MIGNEHIEHCTSKKAIEEINSRIECDGPAQLPNTHVCKHCHD